LANPTTTRIPDGLGAVVRIRMDDHGPTDEWIDRAHQEPLSPTSISV
jgi:hypothetical protein